MATINNKNMIINSKKQCLPISCMMLSLTLVACSNSTMNGSCNETAKFYASSQKDKVFEQLKKDADNFGTKASIACGVGGVIAGIPMPLITPLIGLGCIAVGKYANNYYRETHLSQTEKNALKVYSQTLEEKLQSCN